MLRVGGMFDGIGLLAFGLHLAGLEHAWLCEVDTWRRSILAQRWPGVPIFDDVRAVGARTAERVDVIAGGFPCKGASTAGKRNGFDHAETVLWREMARAVGELRPRYVLVENVANILALHDGAVWGEVLGDLASLGYDVTWDCLPAAAVGAPHLRDRVFAVAAHADGRDAGAGEPARSERTGWAIAARGADPAADPRGGGQHEQPISDGAAPAGLEVLARDDAERPGLRVEWGPYGPAIRRWEAVRGPAPEPLVRRVDDRRAARVERSRLSALGDGVQVQVGHLAGAYIVELERRRLAMTPTEAAA